MVSPYANSHAHEHEWFVSRDGWVAEDRAIIIFEDCHYSEERAAGHSERLDETFYKTMYSCEERRSHRFDVTELEEYVDTKVAQTTGYRTLSEGADAWEVFEDVSIETAEKIELAAIEKLTAPSEENGEPEVIEWFDYDGVDTSDHTVTVHVNGTAYRLTFSHTDVNW